MLLLDFLIYMKNITTTYFVELADFLKRPEIGSSTLVDTVKVVGLGGLICWCPSLLVSLCILFTTFEVKLLSCLWANFFFFRN
jgi:hypothetical protein